MAVPNDKATLILGSTRVPMQVLTDDKGTLQWFMDDRTAAEQDEVLWEMNDFRGGMGQVRARQGQAPSAYLYNLNTEVTREGTMVAGREPNGERQQQGLWTAQAGTWTSLNTGSSHIMECASASAVATIAAANTTTIETSVSAGTGGVCGLAFRWSDASNYWRVVIDDTNNRVDLIKRVATVETTSGTWSGTITPGTYYRLRLTQTAGNLLTVFVDGTQRIQVTDAALTANTAHGLFNGAAVKCSWDWFVAIGYLFDEFQYTTGTSLATATWPGLDSRPLRFITHSGNFLLVTRRGVYYRSGSSWLFRYFVDTDTSQGNTFRDLFPFGTNVFATRDTAVYCYAGSGDTYAAWTESSLSFNAHHMTRLRSVVWAVGSDRTVRSTADPTNSGTWTTQDTLADASTSITAESIVTWGDLVAVGLSDGVYVEDANGDTYHMTPEVKEQVVSGNTRWMAVFKGMLVVPANRGKLWLYKEPGAEAVDISPGTIAPTMTHFNDGTLLINGLASDNQWLYCHLYTTNASATANYQHILRGRLAGDRWVWENFFFLQLTGTSMVTAPAGIGVMGGVLGGFGRLWWGDAEQNNLPCFARYTIMQSHATYVGGSVVGPIQPSVIGLITPHFILDQPRRNFRVHKMRIAARIPQGTIVPYYASAVENTDPLAISWTQCVNSAGSAASVTASGITEVYFGASGLHTRSIILEFLLTNATNVDTPVLEGFTLFGRAKSEGLYAIRFLALVSSSMLGTLQRMMPPSTGTVQTNIAALRDAITGRPQLQGPDGTTYDVDVVSVSVKGMKFRQTPKVGHDYLIEVLAQEARVT